MGRTLNLLDGLLIKAQALHELGRSRDALPILRRLHARPELPPAARISVHHLLGDIYLNLREFRRARQHLVAAIKLEPENATTHHCLALAIQRDPEVNAQRAARHYRRAVELAPDNARLLADAGAFAVEMGRTRKGLALLRRAAAPAPNDLDILRGLIEALDEADDVEARRELNTARFRLGRDPRFQQICNDFEFRQARERQRQASHLFPASIPTPEVLPFLRLRDADGQRVRAKRFARRDAASIQRPHFPRVIRQSDSSHAP